MEKSEWEITWSDKFEVGIAELDDEHRQFISRVNQLNKAIIESEDKSAVQRAMNLMLIETGHHFGHEQDLLAQWKYPEAAAHSAKHVELMQRFERVMKEIADSDISFVWAAKGLHLKQLLVEHLLKEDMKYRDFLRAQDRPG
ncbi:MAG: chemotaxis protein [Betaproteobacteria bacterium]|nr:MAG: chemotaxis protein [Betaproteobacteria bacterium]